MISKINYLTSLSDIYVIYLIYVQIAETLVNGRSTTCHGFNLVLDLNQMVLKLLVFLSSSSLYLSVYLSIFQNLCWCIFIMFTYSISMNFPCLWNVVPVIKMLACFNNVSVSYVLSVVAQSYVKRSF